MLSVSLISSVLALTQFVAVPHEPVGRVGPDVDPSRFAPHGDLSGAWQAATSFEDGYVYGVMIDALGQPLWAMDAQLKPGGKLAGKLIPLEWAGNPALGMEDLAVYGQAHLARSGGDGSFSAVIHSPYTGAVGHQVPVWPLGEIEGVLYEGGWRAGKASAVSSHGNVEPRYHQPVRDPNGPVVIICPKGPLHSVNNVKGAPGRPAGSVLPNPGGVQPFEVGAVNGIQGVPPRPPRSHQVPPFGAGKVVGSWVLFDY